MHVRIRIALVLLAVTLLPVGDARALEPADPDLMPEARAVLDYLESVYGKRVLTGISGMKNAEKVHEVTGKWPAIVATDISGWNSPTWGKSYTNVVGRYTEQIQAWWEAGGIPTVQFHWKHPMKENGTSWVGKHGKNPPSGPFDLQKGTTPGTDEYKAVMRDLQKTGDYLEKLRDAGVPIPWRPLHEIDGGWFWWTDKEDGANTAALWRLIFNYYVKERKLHNLIWVYNAGLKPPSGRDVEQIDVRKRFYPGPAYVDISGIDIYANSYYGWKPYQESAYPKAFSIMERVSPGKILALSESGAIPNPDLMAKDGPKWLYCLPWWAGGKHNPEDWVKKTYTHPLMITRDELPDFKKLADKYR
jgi:mannan endo-1,4-beta-mannosidase